MVKFWEEKGLSSIILVGSTLVLLSESGELALIDASPKQFKEPQIFKYYPKRQLGSTKLRKRAPAL